MSICYHIVCLKCKKYLWIGQSPQTFYSGEKNTMSALEDFLFTHVTYSPKRLEPNKYHELVFMTEPFNSAWEEQWEEEKWEEIDANKYKTKDSHL